MFAGENVSKQTTMKRFYVTVIGSLMLLPVSLVAQNVTTDTIFFTTLGDSILLDEVVVKAHKTPRANSRWSDLRPVDLVTVGGANGDLYRALQTLPGAQIQGESGRLLVRGGSSNETQTYIDGMHVLNPYTTTGADTPARGRYSTFMFSGVNLASGGQSQEYGEALSAVLPLETKDHSTVNKLGMNVSTVGLGGGGTRAFGHSSLSLNLDYQNLSPYYRVYPSRTDFKQPYGMFSGAAQYRYTPDERTVFKLYAGYDRTSFSNYADADRHLFGLGENNVYLNTTFRKRAASGWNWFFGAAYSFYDRRVGGAVTGGDAWSERQQELHLKVRSFRQFTPWLRLDAGVETFIRSYRDYYRFELLYDENRMYPTICAGFLSSIFYLSEHFKTELSFRPEYVSLNRRMNWSPRAAVSYAWNRLSISVVAGQYTQLPENKYLIKNTALPSNICRQTLFSLQYEQSGRFYKAEFYYKNYKRLELSVPQGMVPDGYGYSKGIDLYFCDNALWKNFEYRLSYSYNLSKRKYREYTELTVPQYATRCNVSLVLKYSVPRLRTIFSVTDRLASGRPYHNPELPGLMNDEVKPCHSLDLGITVLASKKVIVHASATNLTGRKNEYGRINGQAVRASSDRFFYLGVYITLGKKVAYDVSNF
ncbi:TonB-dependent receptor plug domain-containing protein [Bacteroides hominis]|uniref:TonB-dependent receptor plug domain-containing protein n=1 Tax=Bacteroides TaxID=816 RepID=UPI00202F5EA2|nr:MULTISPECIES: TonB-dependent receptor plug domain-containing protein [Bacteroides]MCM0235233.1 TonB-dependent receptor plug domain-containing protein [Bacteroides fragilis]MDV6171677.1 TonB-dependent receptor plug domain-containing protein [Bacteroides hominis (ex Liu et al. 2022)]